MKTRKKGVQPHRKAQLKSLSTGKINNPARLNQSNTNQLCTTRQYTATIKEWVCSRVTREKRARNKKASRMGPVPRSVRLKLSEHYKKRHTRRQRTPQTRHQQHRTSKSNQNPFKVFKILTNSEEQKQRERERFVSAYEQQPKQRESARDFIEPGTESSCEICATQSTRSCETRHEQVSYHDQPPKRGREREKPQVFLLV